MTLVKKFTQNGENSHNSVTLYCIPHSHAKHTKQNSQRETVTTGLDVVNCTVVVDQHPNLKKEKNGPIVFISLLNTQTMHIKPSSTTTLQFFPQRKCFDAVLMYLEQGCQMAYFKNKNLILSKFWRVLQTKMLLYFYVHSVYCRAIWYILWPILHFRVNW
jgi:hypothetical protein